MDNNNINQKTSRLKKIVKKKIFWACLVIAVLVLGGLFVSFGRQGQKAQYTTEAVKRGRLTQTVAATGAVDAAHDINLNFKISGKLVYLKADEGDQIKAGAALAQIDSRGAAAQVDQYRASLVSAQADLEKIKAGSAVEDIRVSEEKTAKVENDLANLRWESEGQLKIFREKTVSALNNAVFIVPVALDKVYNTLVNPTNPIQVTDNILRLNVENDHRTIKNNFSSVKDVVTIANSQIQNSQVIISSAEKMIQFLYDFNDFLKDAFILADTIILNISYTQATKDSIKSDISTQQATVNTTLTAVQTAQANLINNINSYSTQIKAAENNLAIYRAELDLKKAGPRDFEIKSAEAKVAQAQAQLNKALADLSDYMIIAPLDGLITKVNVNVGEQVSLSEPAIKMLSTGKFEIKVDIPESDIIKIKIGDKTTIDLDAFGSDHLFAGTISFVDPAQTVIQDVIYYKTTISLDDDAWSQQIKPGMTTNVTISTASKDNVLYVPQRAVKIRAALLGENAEKYVEILINGRAQERPVEVGLRGDNGLVEITAGLAEGERVVTFKKNGQK